MRKLLSMCLVVALGGCYTYVPLETVPKAGAEVKAELAVPADITLREITVHGVLLAEGRVMYADADSLVLAAMQLWSASDSYDGAHIGVTIPRKQIGTLRAKRLSGVKTGLAIGAGGAAIAAVIAAVGPLAGSGSSPTPKPLP
ncbi:MAG: hypothetical protein DMD41_16590 [Gemmatimonadetes bacterium]|nr:MAG: hypothetical protein DMD41_16590 [Gemmatimonadota bacterium]